MVHDLKNITIRLWIAVAAGGLVALGLLAVLGSPLKPAFNLTVAAVLTMLAFLGSGWTFNRIASSRIQDCLREATSRERTANIGEAAEAFRKAIMIFDSFMVSPLFRRRTGRDLAGRIARFHIARAARNPEAEEFIISYLWAHPDDVEIAEYWLQDARLGERADPDALSLTDRIASAQPDNLAILSLIANTYLARGRTDYAALQTYKRLIQESNHIQGPTVTGLADLFMQERRRDEWALEVYLKAYKQNPAGTDYLKGLAACLEQVRESERNESFLADSRAALSNVDSNTIRQWRLDFRQAALTPSPKKHARTAGILDFLLNSYHALVPAIAGAARASSARVSSWMVSIGKQWRESQQAHQVAKWTAVIVFAAVVVVSGISTIIYIKETKEPPEAVSAPAKPEPQIATSGRYTVQAASFRNRQQAVKFAEQIKNRGYPAYFGESRSSEQNIWYYVRISRFENKQEAKEFAEDLKGKGVIDDFYIANYKEP